MCTQKIVVLNKKMAFLYTSKTMIMLIWIYLSSIKKINLQLKIIAYIQEYHFLIDHYFFLCTKMEISTLQITFFFQLTLEVGIDQ